MSIPFAEADGKNKPLLRRALLLSANQHDSLIFLLYALNEDKLSMYAGVRFTEFVEKTNNLLAEAGMMSLYPVNPYEAFILMCIVSDDPLDTFAAVWEKSYEESESSVQQHNR